MEHLLVVSEPDLVVVPVQWLAFAFLELFSVDPCSDFGVVGHDDFRLCMKVFALASLYLGDVDCQMLS